MNKTKRLQKKLSKQIRSYVRSRIFQKTFFPTKIIHPDKLAEELNTRFNDILTKLDINPLILQNRF